ncbi:hypothetical protein HaLaN_03147, partial [Haematococcus lacustris]
MEILGASCRPAPACMDSPSSLSQCPGQQAECPPSDPASGIKPLHFSSDATYPGVGPALDMYLSLRVLGQALSWVSQPTDVHQRLGYIVSSAVQSTSKIAKTTASSAKPFADLLHCTCANAGLQVERCSRPSLPPPRSTYPSPSMHTVVIRLVGDTLDWKAHSSSRPASTNVECLSTCLVAYLTDGADVRATVITTAVEQTSSHVPGRALGSGVKAHTTFDGQDQVTSTALGKRPSHSWARDSSDALATTARGSWLAALQEDNDQQHSSGPTHLGLPPGRCDALVSAAAHSLEQVRCLAVLKQVGIIAERQVQVGLRELFHWQQKMLAMGANAARLLSLQQQELE